MKTKIYKKLILSLGVFIFACVSLLTTTFAWFSIAQDATVGDLSMSISGGVELLVSLDGETFYDNLTTEQLEKEILKNVELTSVTTNDLETFYSSLDHQEEAIYDEGFLKEYVKFDLWFRTNDSTSDKLFLANSKVFNYNYNQAIEDKVKGTYCYSEGVKYKPPVDFQYSESELRTADGEAETYYAADAMRIGIKEANIDKVELEQEDKREELQEFIYDPSENDERGFVSQYGALDLLNKLLKKSEDELIQAPEEPEITTYSLSEFKYNYYVESLDSFCATFQKGADGNYYAKITVFIWCEGWDADCLDGILKDKVLIGLYFRTASVLPADKQPEQE